MPKRKVEQLRSALEREDTVLPDAAEREIQRPVDKRVQKEYYNGTILYLSETCEGSVRDKKICDEEPFVFDHDVQLLQDMGFQDHAPQNAMIEMPVKNSNCRKLTSEEKEANRIKSIRRGL